MSSWIESMYSCSSFIGFVSSKRRWQRPPNSWAIPKLSAIDLGWPMWRYPFGSGGKRVTTAETRPSRTSAATISRMKSLRSGGAGLCALGPLLLINSKRLVQDVAVSGRRRGRGDTAEGDLDAPALEPRQRLLDGGFHCYWTREHEGRRPAPPPFVDGRTPRGLGLSRGGAPCRSRRGSCRMRSGTAWQRADRDRS